MSSSAAPADITVKMSSPATEPVGGEKKPTLLQKFRSSRPGMLLYFVLAVLCVACEMRTQLSPFLRCRLA
jgi:hypothetical protein